VPSGPVIVYRGLKSFPIQYPDCNYTCFHPCYWEEQRRSCLWPTGADHPRRCRRAEKRNQRGLADHQHFTPFPLAAGEIQRPCRLNRSSPESMGNLWVGTAIPLPAFPVFWRSALNSTKSDINEHCDKRRELATQAESVVEFRMPHGVWTVALLPGSA
jgi:hypothetical protein